MDAFDTACVKGIKGGIPCDLPAFLARRAFGGPHASETLRAAENREFWTAMVSFHCCVVEADFLLRAGFWRDQCWPPQVGANVT